MTWPCFLIEAQEPYVEAIVLHGSFQTPENPLHRTVIKRFYAMPFEERPSYADVAWPEICPVEGCDHRFDWSHEHNTRTFMGSTTWSRLDSGETKDHQHDFGPGAMYDATDWTPDSWRGPDGKCWAVVLPPGGQDDFWLIDSEASSGGFWTRTGEAPNLTVSPSIKTHNYHGFLQNGVLTDDVEGKVFK
jgi:hypothetical protein